MAETAERHDIDTRADCEQLVRAFYGRALTDPVIGFLFTDVARLDVEAHVPQIASFWETILLGVKSYSGQPFPPHADLHAQVELRAGHFGRWLALWSETVDELFAGPHAELAKAHAMRVAQAFHQRLQAFPSPADAREGAAAAASDGGLAVTLHGERPARPSA
jgi:hemoglobin